METLTRGKEERVYVNIREFQSEAIVLNLWLTNLYSVFLALKTVCLQFELESEVQFLVVISETKAHNMHIPLRNQLDHIFFILVHVKVVSRNNFSEAFPYLNIQSTLGQQ